MLGFSGKWRSRSQRNRDPKQVRTNLLWQSNWCFFLVCFRMEQVGCCLEWKLLWMFLISIVQQFFLFDLEWTCSYLAFKHLFFWCYFSSCWNIHRFFSLLGAWWHCWQFGPLLLHCNIWSHYEFYYHVGLILLVNL